MKVQLFALCYFITFTALCQLDEDYFTRPILKENGVSAMPFPEYMPEFVGGAKELNLFIKKNLRIPKSLDTSVQVCVQFIIETTGELTNLKIIKPINSDCDNEALRLFSMMPIWIPGSTNSKSYRIPLVHCVLFNAK